MADYQCIALQFPVIQPAMRLIAAITNSNPCVVTTTFAHQYVSETIIRFDIPTACGMPQINQLFGPLTVIDSVTFSVPIDTTTFSPFSVPTGLGPNINICAQSVPIAENNDTLAAAVRNVLPYPLP
jgi:hypothetical protein